jgi:hypothetical protein
MKKFQTIINSYIKEQNLNIPTQTLKTTNIPPNVATTDTAKVLDTLSNVLKGSKQTPQKPDEIIKTLMTALQIENPDDLAPVLASIGFQRQDLENKQNMETGSENNTNTQSNPAKTSKDSYISSAPKA